MLKKKKKIVTKVKPREAVPNEKQHVTDSELQNSPMFDDESDQENEDDFPDDIMPMTKKCNMDIVYKELEKEPKFKNVSNWLKGIQNDVILATVEPTVQAIVPGFVYTELWESLERVASYLNLFPLKVWEMLERVPSYLDLFPLKV